MDIQNLFKKKFVMLDANDTSIKEKDNMFDNVIDNKFSLLMLYLKSIIFLLNTDILYLKINLFLMI